MDEWIDGCMDGWMDGSILKCLESWMKMEYNKPISQSTFNGGNVELLSCPIQKLISSWNLPFYEGNPDEMLVCPAQIWVPWFTLWLDTSALFTFMDLPWTPMMRNAPHLSKNMFGYAAPLIKMSSMKAPTWHLFGPISQAETPWISFSSALLLKW